MFVDARTLEGVKVVDADVCIVGSGAAGLTLAAELEGTARRIVLLESGGLTFDSQAQALYEGRSVGLPYFPLSATRLRYFGGTTNHWTGWCRPMDEIDFEPREWVPHSGWPFRRTELMPYYDRASRVLDLGGSDFSPEAMISGLSSVERNVTAVDPTKIRLHLFRMSPPTRLGEKYRQAIERSTKTTCYLHANAVSVDANDRVDHIDGIDAVTLTGRRFTIRSKWFVLALGGLETPRLLLNSTRRQPQGLGNARDLVGRFFMDHIEMALGIVAVPAALAPLRPFLNPRKGLQLSFGLAPEQQRTLRLLNVNSTLNELQSRGEASIGFGALRRIGRAVRRGEFPERLWADLRLILEDYDEVAHYLFNRALRRREDAICVIMNRAETAPNPASRVMLDDSRDALGQRRIKLDWRLTDIDRRSIYHYQRTLGEELGRLGIGRVRIGVPEEGSAWPPNLDGGHHHMGTTRMHEDARHGVVDAHCRVHGIDNLYVVGSSVFPAVGSANPTLTIVALAIRLAERLKALA